MPYYEGQRMDVLAAMAENFSMLHELATAGNIALAYADFTDPTFIEAVRSLPGFEESTNVIYSSNIADHITNRGTQVTNARVMETLKAYERGDRLPIFIDTLASLNYYLRARQSLPQFQKSDLAYKSFQSLSEKPQEQLIFAGR